MAHPQHAEVAFNPGDLTTTFTLPGGDLPEEVRASWLRSVTQHGLRPDQVRDCEVLTHAELQERRAPVEALSAVCLPEMDRLLQRLGDYAQVVMLSDAQGAVVQYRSSASVLDQCSGLRVLPGSIWTEERQGTTGLGLCLREQRPLSVVMHEHFSRKLSNISCTVAPIFGEEGRLVAVLNVTSMENTSRALQAVLRQVIISSARRIENVYFDRRHAQTRVLRISRYNDFADAAAEARLAIDDNGRIVDATPLAQQMLGYPLPAGDSPPGDAQNAPRAWLGRKFGSLAGIHDLEKWLGGDAPMWESEQGRIHVRLGDAPRPRPMQWARSTQARPSPAAAAHAAPTTADLATPASPTLDAIAGGDAAMANQLRIAQRLHARRLPLLLQGESGSGKTQLARALHESNFQGAGQFVTINCAAIPQELIESELFGYRPGAFTGAAKQGAPGRLVAANGGTLFLDEIGDMPLALQGRLLQVLSEGEFVPVGAIEPVKVRFSLVSATLRDLPQWVREGKFREDLYYRLSGASVVLPPLRARADRMQLIEQAFERAGAEAGLSGLTLSDATRRILMRHAWPGNLRELHHVARFATALCEGDTIEPDCLPPPLGQLDGWATQQPPSALEVYRPDEDPIAIVQTLERNGWNVSACAQQLGVSRATMHRRLVEFNIQRPPGPSTAG